MIEQFDPDELLFLDLTRDVDHNAAMDSIEARNYDRGMWLLERIQLRQLRGDLIKEASGRVLEIGAGTGVNLSFYNPEQAVTVIDIRPAHLAAAIGKAKTKSRDQFTSVSCADVHQLPFADNSFDTVLGTLVFCSIKYPEVALQEIQRVLKPKGNLLLLEHVRGQKPVTRHLTDWLQPVWFALQGECHLNRETAAVVVEAGFHIYHTSNHAQGILQVIKATAPV